MEELRQERAVALGYFDGLHIGHVEVIKAALRKGEYQSAVLTFREDERLPKMVNSHNILSFDQKLELLEDMGVEYIYAPSFSAVKNYSPLEFVERILIQELHARFVSCGSNFRFGKGGRADVKTLKQICMDKAVALEVIPMVALDGEPVSSTNIRRYIENGDMEKANQFLGYEMMFDLPVLHGAKLGRTIGAPTINQEIPEGNVIPRFGVYKSWTKVAGKQYASITNIGLKPTVNQTIKKPLMETHILGFDGDLYGQVIRVALRSFLRPERKFSSVEELKKQIHADMKS